MWSVKVLFWIFGEMILRLFLFWLVGNEKYMNNPSINVDEVLNKL